MRHGKKIWSSIAEKLLRSSTTTTTTTTSRPTQPSIPWTPSSNRLHSETDDWRIRRKIIG